MDTTQLRVLAHLATPGPWAALLLANGADVRAPHASGGSTWVAETRSNADAAYIAALSPARVLLMLDALEKAEKLDAEIGDEYGDADWQAIWNASNALRASLQALKEET